MIQLAFHVSIHRFSFKTALKWVSFFISSHYIRGAYERNSMKTTNWFDANKALKLNARCRWMSLRVFSIWWFQTMTKQKSRKFSIKFALIYKENLKEIVIRIHRNFKFTHELKFFMNCYADVKTLAKNITFCMFSLKPTCLIFYPMTNDK